ncbi:urea ABC transporter permease subunit UrtB [Pseudochelatococcus sp. B33]
MPFASACRPSSRPGAFLLPLLHMLAVACLVALVMLAADCPARAAGLDGDRLSALAKGDINARLDAIANLGRESNPDAARVLEALGGGNLLATPDGRVFVRENGQTYDPVTGETAAVPAGATAITINNRLRRAIAGALAGANLLTEDRRRRLAAARQLQGSNDGSLLPVLKEALARETDGEIRTAMAIAAARFDLASSDTATRFAAINTLGDATFAPARSQLLALSEQDPDAGLRAAARAAVTSIDRHLALIQWAGNLFYGISLGSVLLLAALGLAITFGLMGVINMAHGELLMIGAYVTYVVQSLFRAFLPGHVDLYVVAALPAAFVITALVGMAMERTVIRWLYGRPLETLLATWGISLILMQGVRTLFGAQNVEVANPVWMTGGVTVLGGLVLSYNRLIIIVFAAAVLAFVWLLLNRTRLGLFMRAITQNRRMADCVGVPTGRVDMLAFGLGSGIAGLAGVALSQLGNVGPDLGRGYIVDSFMVVVLGGVGQLSGTVIAAIGLGGANKLLEPFAGAVLAKIAILMLIVLFIQKRPQGLFAPRGRSVE